MSRARVWPADRVADLLWAGAVVLSVVALAVQVFVPTPNVRESPRPALVAPPSAGAGITLGDPALVDAVLRSDVFAPGHVAPRVRWTPPALDTLPPGLAPDPAAAAALTSSAGSVQPVGDGPPRFYGTVIDPTGASALLWLDGRVPGSRLYREGERDGGWRVVRVAPDRVLLESSGGARVTVRLSRDRGTVAPDSAARDTMPAS